MMKKKTVLESAALVTVIMLLSSCLGFLRQALIAARFGSDFGTDVYFTSSEFMRGIADAFTLALSTAVVSIYIKLKVTENQKQANRVANRFMSLFFLFSLVIIAILVLAAPLLARVLAPAYQGAANTLLVKFLRIFSITFLFCALQSSFSAILNANHSFVPGKLYGLIYNPVIIVFMMALSGKFGLYSLFLGFCVANVMQIAILALCCRRFFVFRPQNPFGDPEVKKILLLALPVMFSNILVQCNHIVDKMICSTIGEGTVSSYSFAHSLEDFVTGSITITAGLILFSRFTEMAAANEKGKMRRTLEQSIALLLLILIPIAVIVLFTANDIVGAVYLRGAFDTAAANRTAMALIGFGAGFPILAVREMYTQAHFAHQNTKTPMRSAVISVVLNAGLSFILSRYLGILGVSLATSLSAIVACVILNHSIKRHLPKHRFGNIGVELFKMMLAAAAACLPLRFLSDAMPGGFLLRFVVLTVSTLVIYECVLFLIGSETNRRCIALISRTVMKRLHPKPKNTP